MYNKLNEDLKKISKVVDVCLSDNQSDYEVILKSNRTGNVNLEEIISNHKRNFDNLKFLSMLIKDLKNKIESN